MTNFRLVLLATSALTLTPLTTMPSHAQSATVQFAQAAPSPEGGPETKRKELPPRGSAPKAAPAHPATPSAEPARPAAPAPHAAPPHAPPAPVAPRPAAPPPPHVTPPAATPPRPASPPPHATPPAPPAAPKAAPAPQPATPPAAPKPPTPPTAAPSPSQSKSAPPPAAAKSAPTTTAPTAQPQTTSPSTAPANAEPNARHHDHGGRGESGRDHGGPGGPAGRPNSAAPADTTPTSPRAAPATTTTPNATTPGGAAAPATSPPTAAGTKAGAQPPAAPGSQTALPPGAPVARHGPPTVAAPLPPPPANTQALTPIAPGAARQGPRNIEAFRTERHETQQDGRTIITEPGRVIVRDPSGQSFIRHNEEDRFRYGARDIRQERVGNDTRTVVVRPDGTQIITINDRDGRMLRRIRRDRRGQEIVIIDNSHHDYDHRGRGRHGGSVAAGVAAGVVAGAIGGYFVSLPPPRIGIPRDRYIVEAEDAPPEVIYDTLMAPPVEPIERAYTLDEVRYSPMVRARMPSIDLDTINFETGSWEIPPDQAAKLQVIADGINRAISRNPREVFLIEGHTDAVGNDVDNLSLSDRRAQSAAELLTQQFQVPPENLVTQGYGEQNLKVQTDGPSRENRRVTARRITPLLNGGQASAAPPPRR